MDGPQVEEDAGADIRAEGLGTLNPGIEVLAPDPQGLAPLGVGGHDVARAIDVAVGCLGRPSLTTRARAAKQASSSGFMWSAMSRALS